jgi:hypothetical protein
MSNYHSAELEAVDLQSTTHQVDADVLNPQEHLAWGGQRNVKQSNGPEFGD